MSAAPLAAHDAGARVVVLGPSVAGDGNAVHSGGFLFQLAVDAAVARLDALCFGRTSVDVLEAYAAGLQELFYWLWSVGSPMAGDSPAALAAATGLDPTVIEPSHHRYNRIAAPGRDEDFRCDPETLVALDLTRLHAVPAWPAAAAMTGGPRHDARARVLGPDGSVVPGLYAAGAASLVFGRIAAVDTAGAS